MMRAFSILALVAAGFLAYCTSLLAFLDEVELMRSTGRPVTGIKWILVAVFGGIHGVSLVIGLALNRFQRWKRDAGFTWLASAGLTSLVVFTILCLALDPATRKQFKSKHDPLTTFGDYLSGGAGILLTAGLGGSLVWLDRHERRGRERLDAILQDFS